MSEPHPVFLGGPLHGVAVPEHFVDSGTDRVLIPSSCHYAITPTGRVSALDHDRTLYERKTAVWGLSGPARELVVWVDTELCPHGRILLLRRVILEQGWLGSLLDLNPQGDRHEDHTVDRIRYGRG